MPAHRPSISMLVAAAAFVAAGSLARAEPSESLFSKALKIIDMKTDPGEPQDFVRKSRPPEERQKYIPVGRTGAERPVRAKTPAEIEATEAKLDMLRANHENAAKHAPKPPAPGAIKPRAAPSPGN